jgi:checkpoint serine/threonine-protein kinase
LVYLCIQSKSDIPVKDEIQSKPVPEHRIREAINPRTGRRERVFVDLDAVYPDYKNPNIEVSFEELRAIKRGWMDKNWGTQKEPLKPVSGNAIPGEPNALKSSEHGVDKALQKLTLKDIDDHDLQQLVDPEKSHDGKAAKARKLKLREVKAETQTSKIVPSRSSLHWFYDTY